jgi:putative transposase
MELDLTKKNITDADRQRQRDVLRDQRPRSCSITRGCKATNLLRSTYYYHAAAKPEELSDAELTSIIEDIQDEKLCYGYRRVTQELRSHGFLINHKRVARVMRLAGLGIKPGRRFVRTTDSQHDSPNFPNHYRNTIPDQPDRV